MYNRGHYSCRFLDFFTIFWYIPFIDKTNINNAIIHHFLLDPFDFLFLWNLFVYIFPILWILDAHKFQKGIKSLVCSNATRGQAKYLNISIFILHYAVVLFFCIGYGILPSIVIWSCIDHYLCKKMSAVNRPGFTVLIMHYKGPKGKQLIRPKSVMF